MASTSSRQPTPLRPPETDPQPTDADRIRDAIAARAQRMDEHFPRAVDLEARVLAAMAAVLRGAASSLSGTHAPELMRKMLRGEYSFPMGDLCRLASDPSLQARAAATAALGELSSALEARIPVGTLTDRVGKLAEATTTLLAELAEALASDGSVDDGERAELAQHLGEAERALRDARTLLFRGASR